MAKMQMKWITLDWLAQPRHADKALSKTHQPRKAQVCGVFICFVFMGVQIHRCCSRQTCSQSYIHGMAMGGVFVIWDPTQVLFFAMSVG